MQVTAMRYRPDVVAERAVHSPSDPHHWGFVKGGQQEVVLVVFKSQGCWSESRYEVWGDRKSKSGEGSMN
jgi:hypothetical protein